MLFREFAAARQQHRDRLEEVTFGAYQTVRVWVMTKSKKKMPKFETLLPSHDGGVQTVQQMRTTMQMLAHQYGAKRMRVSTTQTHGE